MDNTLHGYCGIDCTKCDVFQATSAADDDLRRQCAENPVWKDTAAQHWGISKLNPRDMNCMGCHAEGNTIFFSCAKCPIRECARSRTYTSCAECPDWITCRRLAGLLEDIPQAKQNLLDFSRQA
jgi:hypothetical protein